MKAMHVKRWDVCKMFMCLMVSRALTLNSHQMSGKMLAEEKYCSLCNTAISIEGFGKRPKRRISNYLCLEFP